MSAVTSVAALFYFKEEVETNKKYLYSPLKHTLHITGYCPYAKIARQEYIPFDKNTTPLPMTVMSLESVNYAKRQENGGKVIMKRTVAIFLIVVTVLGISTVFAGCQYDRDFYVGQWTKTSGDYSCLNLFKDGSLTLDITSTSGLRDPVYIRNAHGTWEVDGDKLNLQIIVDGRVFDTTAEIKESGDEKHLVLSVKSMGSLGFLDKNGFGTVGIHFPLKNGNKIS